MLNVECVEKNVCESEKKEYKFKLLELRFCFLSKKEAPYIQVISYKQGGTRTHALYIRKAFNFSSST